jgi:hypothetical protein
MLNSPPSLPNTLGRAGKWLILAIVIATLALLFARKITQLALPGLGVPAKTTIIEPQCPTPKQRELIEQNLKLYGAGFAKQYDNSLYAQRLLALARSLGYPEPSLDEINVVLRFLREALKKKC